ncbi:dethiobiotin synthase [Buchnera aphidicola]|uniref:ATP-dependent dethiobiotin synthetase BioD n=1 Tax=Buchnera aphidicola (Sarucallis kahawaluokalani) TaxID=1241878 RepID=A0A4D6Y9Z0_9GAMM|nr:dethiobiotin synthase [Buchnera aphidicola]QCI25992.1 dethiobiotin synthase [Buchnera aphidicola (Sarucallis kahawaluokalani)]
MIKKWFITGTDTNVGKTIVSIILIKKAKRLGLTAIGYKPISSGCRKTIKGLQNSDTLLLQKNSTIQLDYKIINPYAFYHAIPPVFLNNKNYKINFYTLSKKLQYIKKKANCIIIEGIGGWCTPICIKNNLSDWLKKENIPVILVIAIKLGCINHAILTTQSILQSGVKYVGWFANCTTPEKYILNYIYIIKKYISAPFLGIIPYIKDINYIPENKIDIILPP